LAKSSRKVIKKSAPTVGIFHTFAVNAISAEFFVEFPYGKINSTESIFLGKIARKIEIDW
jgi:hypothetical protein